MKTTRTLKLLGLAALVSLSSSGVTLAHGKGGQHFMGVVKEVTDSSVTVETKDKKTTTVFTDANTKVTRGKADAKLSDIKVGEKAVVHAVKHEDHLMAVLVKLGNAAPKAGTRGADAGAGAAATRDGAKKQAPKAEPTRKPDDPGAHGH